MRTLLACALGALLAAGAAAHPPATIGFQGQLATDSGEPMQGTTTVKLRLYSSPRGGRPTHFEQDRVTFAPNGSFVTVLGDGPEPFAVPAVFGSEVWVEVGIGDVVYQPRIRLDSAPFALRALTSPGQPLPVPPEIPEVVFKNGSERLGMALVPTSGVTFLQRTADIEVCVIRIQPWAGIQDGDRVRFVTRFPSGQHRWFRFAERGYFEEEENCPLAKEMGCPEIGGCNIKVASRRPEDGVVAVRDPDQVVEFMYLAGEFFHVR